MKLQFASSYDTHWALRIKPVNDPEFKYMDYCNQLYKQLEEIGVHADVVSYDADLSSYQFVLLPSAFVFPKEYREKFKSYVEAGGTLLATFLSSAKNEDNVGYTESLPAGMTDLFGATVIEVEPIFASNHAAIDLQLDHRKGIVQDLYWCDMLEGEAKPIGRYINTYKADQMIISKNTYGKGTAYYLGTGIEHDGMLALLKDICMSADIQMDSFDLPKGVTCAKRCSGVKICIISLISHRRK